MCINFVKIVKLPPVFNWRFLATPLAAATQHNPYHKLRAKKLNVINFFKNSEETKQKIYKEQKKNWLSLYFLNAGYYFVLL